MALPGPLSAAPPALSAALGARRGISFWREVSAAQVLTQGLLLLSSLIAFHFEKGLKPATLIHGRTSIKGDRQVLICFHEKGFARKQFSQAAGGGGVHTHPLRQTER